MTCRWTGLEFAQLAAELNRRSRAIFAMDRNFDHAERARRRATRARGAKPRSQRAMVAARIATLERGANQHTPIGGSSQEHAAELLNVGTRAVQRAAVSLAADIARLPEPEQRLADPPPPDTDHLREWLRGKTGAEILEAMPPHLRVALAERLKADRRRQRRLNPLDPHVLARLGIHKVDQSEPPECAPAIFARADEGDSR